MNEKDLLGKAVVSMADGAKVGVVKDMVFSGTRLQGLVIDGDRGEGILLCKNFGTVGPDAIAIDSYTIVDWNAGKGVSPDSQTLHDLKKMSVIDDAGTKLGHLHEVILNADGTLHEIAVSTEGLFGIGAHHTTVPATKIHALGPSVITVKAEAGSAVR